MFWFVNRFLKNFSNYFLIVEKPPDSNGDRICDTCNKEDVCMYKGELAQAVKKITQISERVNVFIDTDIRCKKWSGKVSNYRGLENRWKHDFKLVYERRIYIYE